jgi:light-regulated signal transduction histidine kinase (bacteriophytochrome)
MFEDVSQRKQSEEELRKANVELARSNEDLERFAYVASHDLQEPLRAVSAYTELLAKRYENKLDEKADKYIGFALDGARRMQQLISDLLAYSRVGSRTAGLKEVDCAELLEEVVQGLKTAIQESGAVVSVGKLPTITTDRTLLKQVFQNLVSNAVKFRKEAQPRVDISARQDGAFWEFTVADNGVGIDPKFHDRIFVIFQRLHSRGQYSGTGIGLAIVKKIIERQGGAIALDSTPGKGSRFTFSLPVADKNQHLTE